MLKIIKGASETLEYPVDLGTLRSDNPLKAQGLLTPGWTLQFKVYESFEGGTPRITKSSESPSQIQIVSATLARIYLLPDDTADIAILAKTKALVLWYGFGIANTSLGVNWPIEELKEITLMRSLI